MLLLTVACAPPPQPLRIGMLVWPAYELPFVARERGALPPDRVRLVDFRSPAEVMRAYRHGLVDAVAITGGYALELAQESDDHRVILVIDFSRGGDVLLARPEIGSLEELRGARVGLDNSILGFHVLARALQAAGLDPGDVTPVPVDVAEHEEAFRKGAVDAVITYEPVAGKLREAGARPLFDSTSMPGEIVDVLVTRRATLERRDGDLRLLVRAWFRGQRELRDDPLATARLAAAREGIDAGVFLDSLDGLDLVDRRRNRRLLAADSELAASLQSLAALMRTFGSDLGAVDVNALLDDRLVDDSGAVPDLGR